MIIPLLIEQLLLMLVGMLDTIMVSSAGEAAISGVSIVNDVNMLIIQLLAAVAGGGSVVVSQFLGFGDQERTRKSAGQLVLVSFSIAFILGLACFIFHRQILGTLYSSIAPDVMESGCVYFWITALSFPFLGIYNAAAALYRSMGDTKSTMRVSIIMNTINLIGNYILIYYFHMGAAGVAWPTFASRVVAAILMVRMAFNQNNEIFLTWKNIIQYNFRTIRQILTIAIPNGIENGLFQLGKILVSTFVATYGTSQIAANGVTNSLAVLCYATEMAMQLAMVTVIGQCVGANDYVQAKHYIHKLVTWAWIMAIGNNLLVYGLSPFALKLYTLTPETLQIAKTILAMECLAVSLLHPLAFVLPTSMRAAGDAKYTMIIGVASMFCCRVAGAYLLGTVLGMGVIGTRIAMYIDWFTRIIFFMWRYRSDKWMEFRVV
jgi:putative MATE family efflux protein